MARLAEMWAENLDKRITAAKTKEEQFSILTKAIKLPANCDKRFLIDSDESESRATLTDYQLQENVRNTRRKIIANLADKHDLSEELEDYYYSNTPKEWGSAPDRKALEYLLCANNNYRTMTPCLKLGTLRCSACFLVAYCSKTCQTEHWQKHKKDCKSEFASPKWKPAWILKRKLMMDNCIPQHVFKEHMWGNTPANDLMRWGFNETKNLSETDVYNKPISMAFIDSGDLRSVIETLASVPENVTSPLHIVINDSNPVVAARNLLMLLAMQAEGVKAIDAVMQAWYSCRSTQTQYCLLLYIVKSMDGFAVSDEPFVLRKTDRKTFSINLYQGNIVRKMLRRMLMDNSADLQAISDERLKVTFDPEHMDYYLFQLKPHQRLPWLEFRRDGLFLPFSAFSSYFNSSNYFIMNPDSKEWAMTDIDDPMNGWDMRNVDKFAKLHNLPFNDLVGCLHFYVRDRLVKALATLERLPVQIDVYCKDSTDLAKTLSSRVNETFDRIETSNLTDENYVGLSGLLSDWAPLLNEKNKNSVLVTLFTNWFGKNRADLSKNELLKLKNNCCPEKVRRGLSKCAYGNSSALRALQDESKQFKEFLVEKMRNLRSLKVTPRQEHRIVPHRLFAPIEACDNFTFRDISDEENYFVVDGITKCTLRERYVEWVLK